MKKFYITTALPYVNSSPHAGFALEIIQADVLARYHRILGEDVFFLTGTDENSLKNVQAAEKEGIEVKELVDRNAQRFYNLKNVLNLSFDDFIRTTEERHKKGAEKLWRACENDIYKKKYKGLYCVGCEAFFKEEELEEGLCPDHKTKPDVVEEENYFFKLSKYQDRLKEIIEKDQVRIIPETRKNETLSFINSGLEDFSISRSVERAKGWGIPVPDDSSQIQFVWFDALSNYINVLGYAEDESRFQEWWQENNNVLHIIGKGILRFHAVYWLAMLLSAELNLPKTIFVHGYLTSAGQKMSKSIGNVVDPFDLVKKYGVDAVRYFLLREVPPTEDGDFTYEKFEERYNSDLAKGIGNLTSRLVALAEGLSRKEIQRIKNTGLRSETNKTWKSYGKCLEEFKFNKALISIWDLISYCDRLIEENRPWDKKEGWEEVVVDLLAALGNIAQMLQPFLPETSEKIFIQLGVKSIAEGVFKIKKGEPLFSRI